MKDPHEVINSGFSIAFWCEIGSSFTGHKCLSILLYTSYHFSLFCYSVHWLNIICRK